MDDYSEEKIVSFYEDFQDFTMSASFDITLDFVDKATVTIQDEETKIYTIEESVVLDGIYISDIKLKGLNGDGVRKTTVTRTVSLYERVPSNHENYETWSLEKPENRFSVELDCKVDAAVNSGFEGQFKVVVD